MGFPVGRRSLRHLAHKLIFFESFFCFKKEKTKKKNVKKGRTYTFAREKNLSDEMEGAEKSNQYDSEALSRQVGISVRGV